MLQFFRNFFKSKLGIIITLAFLALIALAFASSDVANSGAFGGVSGGDRVAVVGKEKLGTAELSMNVTNALDQVRQDDPRMTMQAFVARGGVDEVLDQMARRTALSEFGRENGIRAGDRLVDSEILQIPAFRGADGSFDKNAFLAALNQRGLTEKAVRDDLAKGLMARQLVTPVTFTPQVPQSVAKRYASLLQEHRQGAIAMLPSELFATKDDPTDEQVQSFYKAHSDNYIRPERRVIRYAAFGEEALGDLPPPTDAQIEARFQRDKVQYAAVEKRNFTQVVAATEAAAKEIVAAVDSGKSLDTAAREKGLATATIGPVTQVDFTTSASAAVAQAGFSAAQGALAAPARGGLGWYVLRVDKIDKQPARTLDQVRGEISDALAAEQRRQAIADLTVRIEDEFDDGRALSDVAKEINVELQSTKPATADGRIYQSASETIPPVLARVLKVAFEMEEREPQLAEVDPGKTFVIYDVSDITHSATAPLDEIRDQVVADWHRDQGSQAAKAAADRIIERIGKGKTLAAAISEEKKKRLPPPSKIDLGRRELAQRGQVPPPLALFFSMAAGTVKKLEGPAEGGWYVIQLDKVEPGKVEESDPVIATTARQLGQVAGDEYAEQFMRAVEGEIGVERNQVAIDAVAAQLTGQSN